MMNEKKMNTTLAKQADKYSLKAIFNKNKLTISLTLMLVVIELVTGLLIPLFMGFAINDLMAGRYDGLSWLGILLVLSIVFGSMRRFYDSRVYGKIYIKTASSLVNDEKDKGSGSSKISARIGLLTELVEFFENSFPDIVNGVVGTLGVVIILWSINHIVCLMCLAIIVVIIIVYGVTGNLNLKYHTAYNNELETLVDKLESEDRGGIESFFKNITRTNIKLSDLETVNYSLIISIAMVVFVASMMISVDGQVNYGQVFALIMYVFEFIERIVILPLYYQNYIRLKEISGRLSRPIEE